MVLSTGVIEAGGSGVGTRGSETTSVTTGAALMTSSSSFLVGAGATAIGSGLLTNAGFWGVGRLVEAGVGVAEPSLSN